MYILNTHFIHISGGWWGTNPTRSILLPKKKLKWKLDLGLSFHRKYKRKLLSCVGFFVIPWITQSWNYPGQSTGVGIRSLLQDIFPTQESSPGLPHCSFFTSWATREAHGIQRNKLNYTTGKQPTSSIGQMTWFLKHITVVKKRGNQKKGEVGRGKQRLKGPDILPQCDFRSKQM